MQVFVILLGWGICTCAPYVVCMFPLILMTSAHPWLIRQFVYNTPGRIGSNFVLLLFLICVLFLFVYFSQCHSSFLVYYFFNYLIIYTVPFHYCVNIIQNAIYFAILTS
jgi:hypothetical protein